MFIAFYIYHKLNMVQAGGGGGGGAVKPNSYIKVHASLQHYSVIWLSCADYTR